MSRKPTAVNDHVIKLLQQFVRNKTHLPCSSFADMQQLQLLVNKEVNDYISTQTLNRFFGLIHNDFKPAASTLDILSRFVNYQSFTEFELLNEELLNSDGDHSGQAELIMALLAGVKPSGLNENGLLCILKNLVELMEKSPSLAKEVYPFLASTEFGQKYFFEHFVNIDALNTHYGEGLNFYLMHAKSREQLFFAYNMLCFRYFLSNNRLLFSNYFNKIVEYKRSELKTFHPLLIARYYTTIIFNSALNNESADVIDEAVSVMRGLKNHNEQCEFLPTAEYVFARALVLIGEHGLALEILRQDSTCIQHIMPSAAHRGFINQYRLLQLYAGYHNGQITEQNAIKQMQSIEEEPFYFLSQNFFTLLLLNLRRQFLPKSLVNTIDRQIEVLVQKTGFYFFEKKDELDEIAKSA